MLKLLMFFKQLLTRFNDRRQSKFNRKNILTTFAIIFLFFASVSTFAQNKNNPLQDWADAEAARNEDRMEQANWVYHGDDSGIYWANGALNGTEMSKLFTAYVKNDTKSFMAWRPGGINGSTIAIASAAFTPAASGTQYLAMLKNNLLGINKPAYAQGVGAQGFAPLLPLWQAFRNAIYIVAAVFFVFIGIMITLRVKISPQAVINIQNALPNIITTLILITFSYAIAGLIIDVSYFILGFVLALLFSAKGVPLNENFIFVQNLTQDKILGLLGLQNVLKSLGLGTDFANLVNPNFFTLVTLLSEPLIYVRIISTIIGTVIGVAIGAFAGTVIAPGVGTAVGTFAGAGIGIAIVNLVISIIIFINLFRFVIGLIRVYFDIILKIIFAPIEIAFGALPNSKMGFNSWLFELFAKVSVFPFTIIFLVIINYILEQTLLSQGLWFPLNLGVFTYVPNVLPAIVAFAGIVLLPRLPEMIPQILYNIKPSPWGTAVGEGIGAIANAPAALYGSIPAMAKPVQAGISLWRTTRPPAETPTNTTLDNQGPDLKTTQNTVLTQSPVAGNAQANKRGGEVDSS